MIRGGGRRVAVRLVPTQGLPGPAACADWGNQEGDLDEEIVLEPRHVGPCGAHWSGPGTFEDLLPRGSDFCIFRLSSVNLTVEVTVAVVVAIILYTSRVRYGF
jgi:hypothetical protein